MARSRDRVRLNGPETGSSGSRSGLECRGTWDPVSRSVVSGCPNRPCTGVVGSERRWTVAWGPTSLSRLRRRTRRSSGSSGDPHPNPLPSRDPGSSDPKAGTTGSVNVRYTGTCSLVETLVDRGVDVLPRSVEVESPSRSPGVHC